MKETPHKTPPVDAPRLRLFMEDEPPTLPAEPITLSIEEEKRRPITGARRLARVARWRSRVTRSSGSSLAPESVHAPAGISDRT